MVGVVYLTKWMGAKFAALVGLLCTPEYFHYVLDVLLPWCLSQSLALWVYVLEILGIVVSLQNSIVTLHWFISSEFGHIHEDR